VEYEYPHDFPNDWVKQQYLPDKIKNAQYYHPKNNGKIETALKEQYLRLRQSFGR
ncbi:MAG: recombinase RarA, partial [Lentilactobacillus hilgardii]